MVSSKRVLLVLEKDLHERIKFQATRFGNSAAAYMRMAMTEKLEKDEETEMPLKYRSLLRGMCGLSENG